MKILTFCYETLWIGCILSFNELACQQLHIVYDFENFIFPFVWLANNQLSSNTANHANKHLEG